MIQKWGIKRNVTALISRVFEFALRILVSRGIIFFTFCIGLFLADTHPAKSQSSIPNSKSVVIIRYPPPILVFPPPNDNFTNSILVTSSPAFLQNLYSGAAATKEPGEPPHEGHAPTNSVWWHWIAPEEGIVQIVAKGRSRAGVLSPDIAIPVYIGIYTGDQVANLTPIELLPDTSANVGTDSPAPKTYLFRVAAGEDYHIAADCSGFASFSFSFGNLALTQPTNLTRVFSNEPVTLEYAAVNPTNTVAWLEAFADTNSLGVLTNEPFQFQYTPPASGSVAIFARGANSDGHALFSVTNTLTFTPINDDFANATVILNSLPAASFDTSTRGSSSQPGEPNLGFDIAATSTVWWRWEPAYPVPTTVTLFSPYSILAIFKGTQLGNLQLEATLQTYYLVGEGVHATFTPEPGGVYYVAGQTTLAQASHVQWRYDQQTLELSPAGPQRIYLGEPIQLGATFHELNSPQTPIEFLFGEPYLGFPGYYASGSAGVLPSEPYQITWTPTNGGTTYVWARCTNNLGMVRESPATEFQIVANNDDFAHPTVILADTRTTNFIFNSLWTSVEPSEPQHRNGVALGTRWWKWTPSYSGIMRFKAVREYQGIPLEIFTGTSLTNLRRVADNLIKAYRPGLAATLRIPVRAGQTYFIRVDDTRPSSHPWPVPPTDISLTIEPASNPLQGQLFLNFFGFSLSNRDRDPVAIARVFMPDGQPVTGSRFQAQLCVGTDITTLAAVGPIVPFYSTLAPSSWQGAPYPVPVILPHVKAFSHVLAKVRVWDSYYGDTFEAVQAAGALVGESKVLKLIVGSEDTGPAPLTGISSFNLHGPK